MGAAQSSRDEIRRNLKLEFILAQARGLEGEALFDHMAAVTEAKIVGAEPAAVPDVPEVADA